MFGNSPGLALNVDFVSFATMYKSEDGLLIVLITNYENGEISTKLLYSNNDFLNNQDDDF